MNNKTKKPPSINIFGIITFNTRISDLSIYNTYTININIAGISTPNTSNHNTSTPISTFSTFITS